MDRTIWQLLRSSIVSADRRTPRSGRRPRYADAQVVKMYFWAVAHDRPLCWACRREHYHSLYRPARMMSYSQFCRRVKAPRVRAMIQAVNHRLAHHGRRRGLTFFDGKALPVSESSRDPDAKTGRGNGRFSRGYKLHAAASADQRVLAFQITPLNAGEPTVAREYLAGQLPRASLTLADANYDSNPLHTAMDAHGHTLVTPLRGHCQDPKKRRRMSAGRQRLLRWWDDCPSRCRALLKRRGTIERVFANISNFGGSLTCLPPWVRRWPRVTLWVTAKLAIYHARLITKKYNP